MNTLTKQHGLVRAQIEAAFAGVPAPGDESLCDGSLQDDDYEDVFRDFAGKHWRDLVPARKPPPGRANPLLKNMFFCSVAAWHFFLPAYLIADLMRGQTDINFLGPDQSEWLPSRFSRLNAAQCAALAAFLDYAGARLNARQEKTPQYAAYFDQERRQLAFVREYWNSRAEETA